MLIKCSSCNSKYLVNSADLQPNGRIVRCAKCGFDWYQSSDYVEEKDESFNSSTSHITNKYINEENNKNTKSSVSNLPSTYVKEQKPSIINTLLLLFFVSAIVFCFWIITNETKNIKALINFYVYEFYFNLKLIINDFANIIHEILN